MAGRAVIRSILRRCGAFLILVTIFVRELAVSSVAVARLALAKNPQLSPAIIAVPMDLRTDAGIATLANLVSLTPGTTSLHVSDDRRLLYVHCLDAPAADLVAREIKAGFGFWVREMERR